MFIWSSINRPFSFQILSLPIKWTLVLYGDEHQDPEGRQALDGLHVSASRATLGGMISNNSSGMRSVIYGMTIDHVLALRVMLAGGSVALSTYLFASTKLGVAGGSWMDSLVPDRSQVLTPATSSHNTRAKCR